MNTRIPSPARSVGGNRTPRRYIKRGSRSVGSPARSDASGRLTSILNMNVLSPLPSHRSVLTDCTDIQEPRRKSWWREFDENSGDVLDILESVTAGNEENAIEELIEMKVLSQEKRNHLDLPESSDSESINSIILPQRKLFTQKEVQPKQKFVQIFGNRDSLAKANKKNCDNDKTINAGTKDLFQNKKQRKKPVFPAALLSVSPNKTIDDIFKETHTEAPRNQVRSIFNNKPPAKRKNMFAEFVITESDDEITEIQPKIFEFQKKTGSTQHLQNHLNTSNITNDTEMDDWTQLPSSTMVDKQIEEQIDITPKKKCRLSKLSEAKESQASSNSYTTVDNTRQTNKTLKNVSIKSSNNIDSSFKINQIASTKNNTNIVDKNTSKPIESNESFKGINKTVNSSQSQSKQHRLINTSKDKTTETNKVNNQTIQETEEKLSYNMSNHINMESQNESAMKITENVENQSDNIELEEEGEDNNFTLEYDNDDEESPIISDKLNEEKNISTLQKSLSLQKEVDMLKRTQKDEGVLNELVELNAASNNMDNIEKSEEVLNVPLVVNASSNNVDDIIENRHEHIDKEKSQIQDEQVKENRNVIDYNLINKEAQNDSVPKESKQKFIREIESQTQNNPEEENEIVNENNFINNEEAKNVSVQEDNAFEKIMIDEAVTNEEAKQNEDRGDVENSLQDECDEIEKNAQENVDNIGQESDVDECEIQENQSAEYENHEEDENENFDSENQYSDDDHEMEETIEDVNEMEEATEDDNEVEEAAEDDNEMVEVTEDDNEVEEAADDDNRVVEATKDDNEVEEAAEDDNEMVEATEDDIEVEEGAEDDNETVEATGDDNEKVEATEDDNEMEEEESEDVIDKTESSNGNTKSPEVILHDKTNQMDSLIGGHSNSRKSKSLMLTSPHIKRSMATVQDVTGFSDAAKDSSAENSYWDSHRTTRKTLRQTLGKDFTLRKSLRTLVMEKSARRVTAKMEMQSETAKFPQANSTEFLDVSNRDHSDEHHLEQSEHEVSRRTKQATLEMCFQKMKQKSSEQRMQIEEAVKHSLKQSTRANDIFKVPKTPISWKKRPKKPAQNKSRSKQMKSLIPLDDLPTEVLEDLKYKPPKRFKPSNASWITPSLYKFLENKLQAKYDYKARVRAEKLVESIYEFTKNSKRYDLAPAHSVELLKHEMARLDIVRSHFEFYDFFQKYMPREIRIKVVPDIVNKIPSPRHGIFSNIIRE